MLAVRRGASGVVAPLAPAPLHARAGLHLLTQAGVHYFDAVAVLYAIHRTGEATCCKR
jgi:hypothetical protein